MFDSTQIPDYFRIVYRRRWLAVSVFLVVVASVVVYTFNVERIYEARTTILIETDAPSIIDFKEVLQEGSRFGDYYQTQYELLASRALAQKTVTALQLWERPEFRVANEEQAIGRLMFGLRVNPVRGSRLVNVAFRHTDPELTAEVVNAHAKQYIAQSLENRFQVSKEASEWLDGQLAEERKRVQATESALQAFRENNDAVSLGEGQNIVVQKLSDLNTAVTRAKTNRIEKEAQYRELLAAQQGRSAVESFPAILASSFIQQLKGDLASQQRDYAQLSETLGERHPTLIEKRSAMESTQTRLDAEIARVVESVRNAYRAAETEEATLVRALDEQKRVALSLNRRGIEYAALEREAESVRAVYQSLLQRAKETGVSRQLTATNIRIIDYAQTPRGPISPRPTLNLFIAIFGGTLLALGSAFVLELIDDRVKTPDDIKGQLGQEFLGLVPEVHPKDGSQLSLLRRDGPAAFTEAFRALRTSVVSAAGAKGPKSILVASSGENEGKTLVATNLAIALAQAQQRVLLIDADLRRPSIHEVFGQRLEPGLSNVLAGSAALADALRPTAAPGLTVMFAGAPSATAPELLGSVMFKDLFDILQEHYTWVIIDSPPVLTVTDASVLARRTSGVVFVVGSGMTRSRAARLAVDDLQRAGGNMIGTVLNRADLQHHPYYFAPYSRGEYGDPTEDGPMTDEDFALPAAGGGRQATASSMGGRSL